jgi:hypothetical protein
LGTPGRRFESCCPDHAAAFEETFSIVSREIHPMTARIYRPAKTAMQSGTANSREWLLEYEPEQPREIEPLMGWTSSGDMRQQIRLRFDSAEEAVAYCERHGIAYQLSPARSPARRAISYSDNFSFKRSDPWTH